MDFDDALFDWDDADEPGGNTAHVAEHGLTPEEVESVLCDPLSEHDESDSSGRPICLGYTETGSLIAVVYEVLNEFDPRLVRVVTAYEVHPQAW